MFDRRGAVRLLAAGIAGIAVMLVTPADAQVPRRPLSVADRADIERVETYLNALHTLRARFLQIADNGQTSEGTIYLSRPGRMRLDYDPPTPILLVATGDFLVHYDKALKSASYLPIDSTPAGLLLRDKVALSGDVTVTGVERGPAVLRVNLVQSRDVAAGRLTLVFSERPFGLVSWQVVDAQGQLTRVSLADAHTGVELDPALFRFTDPNFGAPNPTR
ncbi:MAG: outer membrane lipoprotein carrier protein LolA [Rhodospirillales bacterium]|nr:outer membrane lipoprotein carrier protein LolA [Rhodospirillales bacterium]